MCLLRSATCTVQGNGFSPSCTIAWSGYAGYVSILLCNATVADGYYTYTTPGCVELGYYDAAPRDNTRTHLRNAGNGTSTTDNSGSGSSPSTIVRTGATYDALTLGPSCFFNAYYTVPNVDLAACYRNINAGSIRIDKITVRYSVTSNNQTLRFQIQSAVPANGFTAPSGTLYGSNSNAAVTSPALAVGEGEVTASFPATSTGSPVVVGSNQDFCVVWTTNLADAGAGVDPRLQLHNCPLDSGKDILMQNAPNYYALARSTSWGSINTNNQVRHKIEYSVYAPTSNSASSGSGPSSGAGAPATCPGSELLGNEPTTLYQIRCPERLRVAPTAEEAAGVLVPGSTGLGPVCALRMPSLARFFRFNSSAGVTLTQSPAPGEILYPAFANASNPAWAPPLPGSSAGVYNVTVAFHNPTEAGPTGACSFWLEVDVPARRPCPGAAPRPACPPPVVALPLPADGSCAVALPDLVPNVTMPAETCLRPNPPPALLQEPAPRQVEVGTSVAVNVSLAGDPHPVCSSLVPSSLSLPPPPLPSPLSLSLTSTPLSLPSSFPLPNLSLRRPLPLSLRRLLVYRSSPPAITIAPPRPVAISALTAGPLRFAVVELSWSLSQTACGDVARGCRLRVRASGLDVEDAAWRLPAEVVPGQAIQLPLSALIRNTTLAACVTEQHCRVL
eukprot:tig00021179_g19292.t1